MQCDKNISFKFLTMHIYNEAVVDPYIEREMLLIFIDIVLHRKTAFRHLLFHRFLNDRAIKSETSTHDNTKLILDSNYLIQCTFKMFALIFIHDLFMEQHDRTKPNKTSIDWDFTITTIELAVKSISLSVMEHITMFLGTSLLIYPVCRQNISRWNQLFVATVTPAVFMKAAYSFLRIWDQTEIVQWISWLLISTFQLLFITIMLERYYYKRNVSVSSIGIISVLIGNFCKGLASFVITDVCNLTKPLYIPELTVMKYAITLVESCNKIH